MSWKQVNKNEGSRPIRYGSTTSDDTKGVMSWQGWVDEASLGLFLDLLAMVARSKRTLSDWDCEHVLSEIEKTDEEADRWFSYEIVGEKRTLGLRMAKVVGSGVYPVHLSCNEDISELVEIVIFSAQHIYRDSRPITRYAEESPND